MQRLGRLVRWWVYESMSAKRQTLEVLGKMEFHLKWDALVVRKYDGCSKMFSVMNGKPQQNILIHAKCQV